MNEECGGISGDREEFCQEEIREESERIVASGEEIRERVERLILGVVSSGKAKASQLAEVASQVLEGTTSALRQVAPEDRVSHLRQSLQGVEEAFGSTINAAFLSLKEMGGRGTRFAKDDVQGAVSDLEELQRLFMETLQRVGERGESEVAEQLRDLQQHMERVTERLRPSLNALLEEAARQPKEFAVEAGSAFAKKIAKVLHNGAELIEKKLVRGK